MTDLHMVRDVLDKLLRDKSGRDCGRVDSVIVKVRPGEPAVAAEIECGIFVALRRVNEPAANWLERMAMRVIPIPLGSIKLSLDKFSHEAGVIQLPIDSESDPHLLRAEKWLRKHVVERIPGGVTEKSK